VAKKRAFDGHTDVSKGPKGPDPSIARGGGALPHARRSGKAALLIAAPDENSLSGLRTTPQLLTVWFFRVSTPSHESGPHHYSRLFVIPT